MASRPMLPMETDRKPIVAIVGAGIAGLTLAVLLGKQGVSYEIYERAKQVKPLGSAIGLGVNVAPLFKQMGIFEEFTQVAKVNNCVHIYNERRELKYQMMYPPAVEMGGGESYIVARPALYNILLNKVPKERLHLGKKVLSFIQNENGIMLRTSDNQTHEADILVGADGAYSAVRQSLYAELKAEKKLPASDNVPLPFTCVCLVGQTGPVDPEWFPDLKNEQSPFVNIIGEEVPYSLSTITTKQNTVCWAMMQYLDKTSIKNNDSFRNSEWGPEAAEQMCKDVRHFEIPGAAPGATPLTLGDLIDRSPREYISKVMLEEKVFKTWTSGRTVLIGDACHKFNPAGGQGALNAIHDAVALANWISVLPSTELHDVGKALGQYKKERYPVTKAAYETSKMMKNLGGKNMVAKMLRHFSKNMPDWLWRITTAKMVASRPQVSFLPLAEDKGTVKPQYQPSLQKTLKIAAAQAEREKKAMVPVVV